MSPPRDKSLLSMARFKQMYEVRIGPQGRHIEHRTQNNFRKQPPTGHTADFLTHHQNFSASPTGYFTPQHGTRGAAVGVPAAPSCYRDKTIPRPVSISDVSRRDRGSRAGKRAFGGSLWPCVGWAQLWHLLVLVCIGKGVEANVSWSSSAPEQPTPSTPLAH